MALGDVSFSGKSGLWNGSNFSQPISSYIGLNKDYLIDFVETEHSKGNIVAGVIPFDVSNSWGSVVNMNLSYKKINVFSYAQSDKKNKYISHKPTVSNLNFPNQAIFNNRFAEIIRLIKKGQIYQINLTDRVTAESNYSVVDWFSYIAHEFPRAHTCLFDLGEQQIISASPEMFLCIDAHRTVKTEPIKGTARVVGFDAELLASRKEEAELAMITDLLRNDLSEVCDAGTVVVENDRKVQHLERITHTSSIISGKLKENISPIRALVSCFPGGSITGCPKSEAIKSIVQLEPNPRGFYTGCAFQILADGSLNSSILIRTLEKTGNQLKLGVGSGIVWDSNVEDEYQEMLNKAYLLTDLE